MMTYSTVGMTIRISTYLILLYHFLCAGTVRSVVASFKTLFLSIRLPSVSEFRSGVLYISC